MNEATPHLIDHMAASALIEPLTDLVIRAGAAILAVNRAAMRVDGKTDGSPVTEADLAAAARRKARAGTPVISPIALEAVQRIDELFAVERDINGLSPERRLAARQERSAPPVAAHRPGRAGYGRRHRGAASGAGALAWR